MYILCYLGYLVRRQRLPKNDAGESWNWRDLNNGVDLTVYGKVFHLSKCDKFTKVCIFNMF